MIRTVHGRWKKTEKIFWKQEIVLENLTDEFGGKFITDWVGTEPKSYAYKTNDGKTTCKVKGFTLNYKNSKKINLESMKEVILEEGEKIRIENNAILKLRKKKL